MNPYRKLFGNSLIFAIGNFGSKFVSILIVPFFTRYLNPAEYGQADLLMITINILLPIVTLSIYEALIRFYKDETYKKNEVVKSTIFVLIVSIFLSILSTIPLAASGLFENYLLLYLILLIIQSINVVFQQMCRSMNYIKAYSINGLVTSLLLLGFAFFYMEILGFSLEGFYFTYISAFLISNIYLLLITKAYKNYVSVKVNVRLVKQMLLYCLPLIPNSLFWLIVNSSSRYFLLFFRGDQETGLFAVSTKIPSLIVLVYGIFFQSWQLSAIEEYDREGKNKGFYNNVLSVFMSVMFMASALIIVFSKEVMVLFSPDYYEGWRYTPLLVIGNLLSGFSGFLGTGYIVRKDTKNIFTTSLVGALVSILLNYILIPRFGGQGAALSLSISFFIILIIRYSHVKNDFGLRMDHINILLNSLLLICISFVKLSQLDTFLSAYILTFMMVLLFAVNRQNTKLFIKLIR